MKEKTITKPRSLSLAKIRRDLYPFLFLLIFLKGSFFYL
nr:MAG TPA: hypothetical protein [Caudoviricetes sp.]